MTIQDPNAARVRAAELFNSGVTDKAALAKALNDEGFRTMLGKRFDEFAMRFFVTKDGKLHPRVKGAVKGGGKVEISTIPHLSRQRRSKKNLLVGSPDLLKRVINNQLTEDDRIAIVTMLVKASD